MHLVDRHRCLVALVDQSIKVALCLGISALALEAVRFVADPNIQGVISVQNINVVID